MMKKPIALKEALYPVPVVLVSVAGGTDSKANIITIAWCGIVCSQPPLISISIRPSRYSHKLITKTRDFVVNVPSSAILDKVDRCGIASGLRTDKFKLLGLTSAASEKISSPIIAECPVNIECSLRQIVRLGTHDMFIAEVLAVRADRSIVDEDGKIDFSKADPLVYNHGEYWTLAKRVGLYGFSAST